jgi:transposase
MKGKGTAMTTMADPQSKVTGGVDTHKDFHVAAVLSVIGKVLASAMFPTTHAGYLQLISWLESFGPIDRVGVEGTGSWGKGLTRVLTAAGIGVVEVIRPNRQTRRRYGKSDRVDAIAAARAVLNGEATARPRNSDGPVESIRLLKVARNSAIKQRTATANQIHAVMITATETLRESLGGLSMPKIVDRVTRYRPTDAVCPTQGAKLALKTLGQRWRYLSNEIATIDETLDVLVEAAAPPELLAMMGVGTQTAAQLLITAGENPDRLNSEQSFAALCGVSPVDASSGLQLRHRLNRGGDRQANSVLYRIAIVRLRYHQPTRNYMTRRTAQGLTKKEVIRCLKRYLAREIWQHLTNHQQTHQKAA